MRFPLIGRLKLEATHVTFDLRFIVLTKLAPQELDQRVSKEPNFVLFVVVHEEGEVSFLKFFG